MFLARRLGLPVLVAEGDEHDRTMGVVYRKLQVEAQHRNQRIGLPRDLPETLNPKP